MTFAFQRMFGILERWNNNQVTPSLSKPHELSYRSNISVDFIRNLINNTPTEIEEIVNVMLEEEESEDPAQEKKTNEENARKQAKILLTSLGYINERKC